jgi:hypothetical protein
MNEQGFLLEFVALTLLPPQTNLKFGVGQLKKIRLCFENRIKIKNVGFQVRRE